MASFSSQVAVVKVKRQQHLSDYHRKKETLSQMIRVTRVKRNSQRNAIEDKATVPTLEGTKVTKADPCIVSPTKSLQTPKFKNHVDPHSFRYAGIQSHSVAPLNQVNISPTSFIIEQKKGNSTSDLSAKTTDSASKKISLNNISDSCSMAKLSSDSLKVSRRQRGQRWEAYTIRKTNTIEEKHRKSCLSSSSCRVFILVLVLFLVLTLIAVILSVLLVFKTNTTTTATLITTVSSNVTNTTNTTFILTSTLTSSTSSASNPTTTTTTATSSSTSISTSTTFITSSTSSSILTTITTITTASTTSGTSTITITSNTCTSSLSGITMVASCSPCSAFILYYEFIYNYTAIATTTILAFSLQRVNAYFAVDDVSVRDYAAPSTEILVNGGFESGTLTPWIYCNQLNASSTGGVRSNFSSGGYNYHPKSGVYFYVGGSNISADYLFQSFSTQVGHLYKVTINTIYPGTDNMTSAALFLSV